MNVLVTGANGQLGSHIRLATAKTKGEDRYFYTDVDTLDIADEAAVNAYLELNEIDVIINCAAYTNVDKAEDEESAADGINHRAVAILAEKARKRDALMVHVSTDYVFGGNRNNTPCEETQPTNPTGAYGRTKLAGEKAVEASGCRYVIVRTAWLYSEYGKNFVKTMLNVLDSKPQCKVVYDQVGTPTYAGDLAKALLQIVRQGVDDSTQGIYHYSNEGVCSWYDFTQEIARLSGHTACDIQPCRSHEYPSKVVRPSYSVLDKTKIKQTFGVEVPYWTDSLKRCLDNMEAIEESTK